MTALTFITSVLLAAFIISTVFFLSYNLGAKPSWGGLAIVILCLIGTSYFGGNISQVWYVLYGVMFGGCAMGWTDGHPI